MRSRTQPTFRLAQPNEYSNTDYALLGIIVEKVDCKPLAQAMRDRLFAPPQSQHTELSPLAVNTIPQPHSHGYLHGSSAVALVGEPAYSPKQKVAVQASTFRPDD